MERLSTILANNLTGLRRAAGLSQEQLAEMADVHVNTIKSMEGGWGNPRLSTLESVAKALVGIDCGAGFRRLLSPEGEHDQVPPLKSQTVHKQIEKIVVNLDELSVYGY